MKVKRGEIWIANLDPTQGSEQAGMRPIIIFQENIISQFTNTIITIPLTTNIKRASLPSCLLITKNEGGLNQDSVALCHQIRVLDKMRLSQKIGQLNPKTIYQLVVCQSNFVDNFVLIPPFLRGVRGDQTRQ